MTKRYVLHLKPWLTLLLVLCAVCVLTLPHDSYAITDSTLAENFRCNGGTASGPLFSGAGCPGSPKDGKVFSYFVCQFEKIIADTLGDVYCSIVDEAKPAVMAALTMAVLFFGIAMLMGVSPFTAKELMIMAGKFSLVLAFATKGEYMIGVGYNLFMSISKEGIVIVISYLFEGQSFHSDQDVYRMFDNFLKEFMSSVSKEGSEGNQCKSAIFALITVLAAALPPLFFIGIYFLLKLLWVILRAVFGYCQGILAVSFLITLSPIYVSFGLFKATRALFDKWLQYLISFSFQMVIVFAFLGMVFSIAKKSADDMKSYTDLVKPYDQEFKFNNIAIPFKFCGICELNKTAVKGKPTCKSDKALAPGEMVKNENLLEFASVKVIAMVILFYILDIMMDFVPQMAVHLAGPKYAGRLGGGQGAEEGNLTLPGENKINELIGKAVQGYKTGSSTPGGIAGAISGIFKLSSASTGTGTGYAADAGGGNPYQVRSDSAQLSAQKKEEEEERLAKLKEKAAEDAARLAANSENPSEWNAEFVANVSFVIGQMIEESKGRPLDPDRLSLAIANAGATLSAEERSKQLSLMRQAGLLPQEVLSQLHIV